MARTNDLMNFLTDVATAIKTKKGDQTDIPAANFDTEILNLPSATMDPTTATINDVINPETFYSNGNKLTGAIIPTIESRYNSYTKTIYNWDLPSRYDS